MVPGMTERERRAAEVRQLAWLADAALGPARMSTTPPAIAPESQPAWRFGIWRRGVSSARVLGQRIRLLRSEPGMPIPDRALKTIRQAGGS